MDPGPCPAPQTEPDMRTATTVRPREALHQGNRRQRRQPAQAGTNHGFRQGMTGTGLKRQDARRGSADLFLRKHPPAESPSADPGPPSSRMTPGDGLTGCQKNWNRLTLMGPGLRVASLACAGRGGPVRRLSGLCCIPTCMMRDRPAWNGGGSGV